MGSTDEWCTPREVADPLEQLFGGAVGLDPCWNPRSIVKAHVTYERTALVLPWAPPARHPHVYENPPYSILEPFTVKGLNDIVVDGMADHLVRLVTVSPSTGWWRKALGVDPFRLTSGRTHRLRPSQRPTLIFTKRLAFINEKGVVDQGGARFDSVLMYYGRRKKPFLHEFRSITSWTHNAE